MGLGNNSEKKIYLSIGFGKIRQKQLENGEKVSHGTPDAKMRLTQSGKESWALEYDYIEGRIEKIFFKEDREYGNSFEVVIGDSANVYQLSFKENSRFWFDFARKLPNVDFNQTVKITAYDFENKDGKKRAGVSISQKEEKIQSFYSRKTDEGYETLHGYPEGIDIVWSDQDDVASYLITVKKFLRKEFSERIEPKFDITNKEVSNEPEYSDVATPEHDLPSMDDHEDDLPF